MVSKLTFPTTQNQVLSKVNEIIDGKQDNLVSGTNIKTVNGNSLLGAGDITISGGGYHPDLFTWQWADHELNDVQWLRADTFSWQSGSVYQAAYQHLADDITGKTLQSETISGITIRFYLAEDGHKICPASQESNVAAIYNATGVAWYYIIDTTNRRFKLPRTKFGFTGIRNGVGGYVEAGLPNITGSFTGGSNYISGHIEPDGAFSSISDTGNVDPYDGRTHANKNISFSASRSSSIYGNSDTVQPKATEMYLYFYVGQFTQTALENTAGVVTEDFNELNAHKVIAFQEPTSANNYTWYRKYADGWVEQGGFASNLAWNINGADATITLPIVMKDSNYTVCATMSNSSSNWNCPGCRGWASSATQIIVGVATLGNNQGTVYKVYWQVSGMAAN